MVKQDPIFRLEQNLGFKQLSPTWAKLEILLGRSAAGVGLFLGSWALSRPIEEILWGLVAGGLSLYALGGYLALAGNRSHLYQSSNKVTTFLVEEIRLLKDKG
jgi:hypothetical protein